jgi:hypothetical protein
MEYVTIDGRQVLTEEGLLKKGLLNIDGSFDVDQLVKDEDNVITINDLNAIVWNLKRFTSVIFFERLQKLASIFTKNFEYYISIKADVDEDEIRKLQLQYEAITEITSGVELLKKGYKDGYRNISSAINYYGERFDGRWIGENRSEYERMGYRAGCSSIGPHKGLFAWIALVNKLNGYIYRTLNSKWKIPIEFDSFFDITKSRVNQPIISPALKIKIKTGDIVPVHGIWNPISFKSGCPNYLREGSECPTIQIAYKKEDYPEYLDSLGCLNKAHFYHLYHEQPSEWQLLWEDTRYTDGTIPEEESAYLDELTDFPKEPPVAPGVQKKDDN